eukprot:2644945-Alexandrium_andersonii.AAC.1
MLHTRTIRARAGTRNWHKATLRTCARSLRARYVLMHRRAHARVSLTACQSASLSLRVAQTPPLPPLRSRRRHLFL